MLHVETDRITPMAVPLMVIVGREALPPGAEADEALLTRPKRSPPEAMADAVAMASCAAVRYAAMRSRFRIVTLA